MKTIISSNTFFMGIITLILLVLLAWFVYHSISIKKAGKNKEQGIGKLKFLNSIGLLALVLGTLHQLISWYSIIHAIEEAGDITFNIILTALGNSMVPLIYGLSIYLLALILWLISNLLFNQKQQS
ncbi:MAG: hypothetical protein DRJ07_14790 [Bacteroidetes bacterium]|nr:MAG: hypothetical protein DRJ07_14790 [Bacteroidota bacterium]